MDQNLADIKEVVRRAEDCLSAFGVAWRKAEEINGAWQGVTGHEYPQLIEDTSRVGERWEYAARAAIHQIVRRLFPQLPYSAETWARKAQECDLRLSEVPEWFANQVGPTYKEVTWAHILKKTRSSLYRVGEWHEQRREAKIRKAVLSIQVYVREKGWNGEWRMRYGQWTERVRALELIINRAANPGSWLFEPSWFERALREAEGPGWKVATGWHLAPHIRTFANGRFDIHLRDEELARKVKAILEGTDEKI